MGGQSRTDGWIPKMSYRLFNINFNNSFRIYLVLMVEHNPGRRLISLAERMKEATHDLLQRGGKMKTRAPDHPSPVRDMRSVYDTGCGKRKGFDANGVNTTTLRAPTAAPLSNKLYRLKN